MNSTINLIPIDIPFLNTLELHNFTWSSVKHTTDNMNFIYIGNKNELSYQ